MHNAHERAKTVIRQKCNNMWKTHTEAEWQKLAKADEAATSPMH